MKLISKWIYPKHFPVKKCVLTSTLFLFYSTTVIVNAQADDKDLENLFHIIQPKRLDWHLVVNDEFCSCTNPNSNVQGEQQSVLSTPADDIPERTYDYESSQEKQILSVGNTLMKEDKKFYWNLFYPAILPERNQCSEWNLDADANTWVYYFDDIIRLGDDIDINETHIGEDFCISSAYSPTYTATFNIPEGCEYTEAKLQYWVTGVSQDNKILINDELVNTTCNTDNNSTICCTNGPITITDKLHVGINTLRIKTVLFPGDTSTPYDDIEIYRLHISLENN